MNAILRIFCLKKRDINISIRSAFILSTLLILGLLLTNCGIGASIKTPTHGVTPLLSTGTVIPTSSPVSTYKIDSLIKLPFLTENNAQKLVQINQLDLQATTISFSPDGKLFAVGTWNKGIYVYDVKSMALIQHLPSKSMFMGESFSPDGTRFAAAASTSLAINKTILTVFVWRTDNWEMIASADYNLPVAGGLYLDSVDLFKGVIEYAANDVIVLTNGHISRLQQNEIMVLHLQGNNLTTVQDIKLPQHESAWGSTLLADSDNIFCGGRVYNLASGNTGSELSFDKGRITTSAVSRDGSLLVYASLGTDLLRLVSFPDLQIKKNFIGPSTRILAVDISPQADLVAAADLDHNLWVWRTGDGKVLSKVIGTYSVTFSPLGNLLAVIHADVSDDENPHWLVRIYGITDPAEIAMAQTIVPSVTNPGTAVFSTPEQTTSDIVPGNTPTPTPPVTKTVSTTVTQYVPVTPTSTPKYNYWYPCPGVLSRLGVGLYAYVAPGTGTQRVRTNAGIKYDVIGDIPERGVVYIIGGPKCLDGWVWWRVQGSDLTGWTAEGSDATWLVPCTPGSTCP